MSALKRYTLGALVGYLIMFGGTLFAIHEVKDTIAEAHNQQVKTCEIQNTGLEAKKYLDKSLHGIRILLSPLPGEKIGSIPPSVAIAIGTLNRNLDEYSRIEAKLPKEHKC